MKQLQRTNTVLLEPTREQEQQLKGYAEASAKLWNTANYERRQALFKCGRVPTYSAQCRTLKNIEPFKLLGTCKAQALLAKLNEAWGSYFALKRLERQGKLPSHIKKVSPPRYMKYRDKQELVANSIYVRNDGYRQTEAELILSKRLRIRFKAGDLWVGEQGRLELCYDRLREKWYGHIPVKVKWPRKQKPHQSTPKRASIDLGICNLTACIVEGSRTAYIYSGRAVLSDWRYWTKKIATEQKRLAKVNEERTSKKLKAMFRIRVRRLDHAINAMLRDLYEKLEERGVTKLITGNLKHIRQNADHGRVNNQKLHNFWVFQKMRRRMVELSEEYGIQVSFKSERGTSKQCSICGQTHENGRIHRGSYKCKQTGRTLNADVNGALNILYGKKVAVLSGSGAMARPMLLKWNGMRWEARRPMNNQPVKTLEARISIFRYGECQDSSSRLDPLCIL